MGKCAAVADARAPSDLQCCALVDRLRKDQPSVWGVTSEDVQRHRKQGDYAEVHHVRAMSFVLRLGICVISVSCGADLVSPEWAEATESLLIAVLDYFGHAFDPSRRVNAR